MTTAVSLSDLTASLARELAESAASAENRQRDTFVALAAEFSGTAHAYAERAVGASEEERRVRAGRYIDEVVMPLLPQRREIARVTAATIPLDDQTRSRLTEHFGPAVEPLIAANVIERQDLERLVITKLRDEAVTRHRDARALLANGMPRVQLRSAKLEVKVFLDRDAAGSVIARLANETTVPASPHDTVSTLTVDLDIGAFQGL